MRTNVSEYGPMAEGAKEMFSAIPVCFSREETRSLRAHGLEIG
jgi:hypothetical protein